MKNKLIIVLSLLINPFVASASLDEIEFERIKSINSSEGLVELHQHFEDLKINMRACDIQRAAGRLPSACYRSLKLAEELSVAGELRLNQANIERICIDIADRTIELKNTIDPMVSPRCAARAEIRVRMNRYKTGHEY